MSDYQGFWIALQTFYSQELKVSRFLDNYQTKHFIPMMTHRVVTKEGKTVPKHHPAVHNLIFLQIDRSIEELKAVLKECPYPISVYCKTNKPGEWCMIPDSDMMDLRLICDITFTEPRFVSVEEMELKVGTQVRVTHGPMKGVTGKLVRKNKKYYLVKTLVGIAVMVAVSRWCCEAVGDEG